MVPELLLGHPRGPDLCSPWVHLQTLEPPGSSPVLTTNARDPRLDRLPIVITDPSQGRAGASDTTSDTICDAIDQPPKGRRPACSHEFQTCLDVAQVQRPNFRFASPCASWCLLKLVQPSQHTGAESCNLSSAARGAGKYLHDMLTITPAGALVTSRVTLREPQPPSSGQVHTLKVLRCLLLRLKGLH